MAFGCKVGHLAAGATPEGENCEGASGVAFGHKVGCLATEILLKVRIVALYA